TGRHARGEHRPRDRLLGGAGRLGLGARERSGPDGRTHLCIAGGERAGRRLRYRPRRRTRSSSRPARSRRRGDAVRLGQLAATGGHRLFLGGEIQDRFRVHVRSVTPGKQTFDNGAGNPGAVPDGEVIYSAYAGDDWRISPRLLLDAAVRIDDYADSFGAVVNPRIALIVQPYAAGTTKLLFGRAFRAPGIYERFFNDGVAPHVA